MFINPFPGLGTHLKKEETATRFLANVSCLIDQPSLCALNTKQLMPHQWRMQVTKGKWGVEGNSNHVMKPEVRED